MRVGWPFTVFWWAQESGLIIPQPLSPIIKMNLVYIAGRENELRDEIMLNLG
jgi:hypothetical protein